MPAQPLIREIEHDSPEYWHAVTLRDAILRKPLGLQYTPQQLQAENDSRHIVCYLGDRLVGYLSLRPKAEGDVQMRQFAVAADWQGKGIGRALVERAEALRAKWAFATWSSTRAKRQCLSTKS